ncbi:MAG: proprotein convertase P-domain-containing protein [Thiohalospira sp.]
MDLLDYPPLGRVRRGTWRLVITDHRSSGEDGSLDSWTLTFHGH